MMGTGTKMKGLLKGLRYISQIFDAKEEEMQIGNPTDVKHVAHIGWDGPSVGSPSWMNDFGSAQQPATEDDAAAAAPQPKQAASDPHLGSGSSRDSALPRPSRRVDSPGRDGSTSNRHSRRNKSSGGSDSPSREPTEGGSKHGRKNRSTAGVVGDEQPAPDVPAVPKQPHRRKTKGSSSASGGSTKSSSKSKAATASQSESAAEERKPNPQPSSPPTIGEEEEEKEGL
ncbi:hypothetical protein OPV22_003103 [Ensete ventricosum]|uniref:CRIB domain-containing protein n=1 Tax=Ensete ventricosum TaxID=4639 RepID=A0AAV8RZW6_ENSVE|nr:hypothetical protein OPV22_003103 [Ensete ventricosum]